LYTGNLYRLKHEYLIIGKGIFMFNPCHMILLLTSMLLLTKKSENNSFLFLMVTRLNFAPWLALLFPVLEGNLFLQKFNFLKNLELHLPYEVDLFYYEHYLGAIINPMILI